MLKDDLLKVGVQDHHAVFQLIIAGQQKNLGTKIKPVLPN